MSIKTTEFEGDVATGRHATVGGDLKVRGDLTAGHNVKVEGWLEAPNIIGFLRGIFRSKAELEETVPRPRDGWGAFVGDHTYATVYYARHGEWIAGNAGPIHINTRSEAMDRDIAQAVATASAANATAEDAVLTATSAETMARNASASALSALAQAKEANANSASALTRATKALQASEQAGKDVGEVVFWKISAEKDIEEAQRSAKAAQAAADKAAADVSEVAGTVEKMSAGLQQVSGAVAEVRRGIPLKPFRRRELVLPMAVSKDLPAEGVDYVVWDREERRFLAVKEKIGSQPQYYAVWADWADMVNAQTGRPREDYIYLCEEEHSLFLWNGEDLLEVKGAGGGDAAGGCDCEEIADDEAEEIVREVWSGYRQPREAGLTEAEGEEMVRDIFG